MAKPFIPSDVIAYYLMPHSINRAIHLYQISRYADAELELRRTLAEQPHDPHAHALLGLCLVRQEKLQEAQDEVEQAIVLAPDWDYAHFCRAIVLEERRRFEEAEAAPREAVRLNPSNPNNYARLATSLYSQRKWRAALDATTEGLQYDAEHAACTNLRAMALSMLGMQTEALASVDQSLARNPDDSYAHVNKAWALLHDGKPRLALEHFREALRLDPTNDYAKHGMVEALKARNPLYRWMLAYFLWMARLDDRTRWGVILGGYFLSRLLRNMSRNNPELQTWANPILFLYFGFVLLTWFATPLFNLLLRLNRFGRYALSRDQRTASNWFGGCVAVAAAGAVGFFALGLEPAGLAALVAAALALPLVTIYQVEEGWPRQALGLLAGGIALTGIAGIIGFSYEQEWASFCFGALALAAFATPWLANYLATVTVRR